MAFASSSSRFAVVTIPPASTTITRIGRQEEGLWALPHGEFGLDSIALIGTLRYEIHQELCKREVVIAERTVTNLLARYEELVTLHQAFQARLRERLTSQGHVILALDGLQPDVGHEVL